MEGIIQFAQSANSTIKNDYDALMERFEKFKTNSENELKEHKKVIVKMGQQLIEYQKQIEEIKSA